MRIVAASMGMKKQKVKRNLLVTEKKNFNIDLKYILFHNLFFFYNTDLEKLRQNLCK